MALSVQCRDEGGGRSSQGEVQGTGWCQDEEVHLYLVTLSNLPYQEEEEWKIFATDF